MSGLLDAETVVVNAKPTNPVVQCGATDTAQFGGVANATIGFFECGNYGVVRGLALGCSNRVHGWPR